ncbi:energy transducer TonB [Arenibacter aquaticus]|nr:energy transducer TonB [Arenibacter aquaticus]
MRACFNQKLQKHISKNFRYPKEAHEKGIEGRVNLMFTIQEDGNIGNVRMRGPNKLLEDEAARIISLLPKMIPGKHKGKKVQVPFSIPITFKLTDEDTSELREELAMPVENNVGGVPFVEVEKVPVFPGCEDAEDKRACFKIMMVNHVGKNFRYPEGPQEKGAQGRVYVHFTILEDGNIGNVQMRGRPNKLLEDEAARIISLLPQMTPGEHKGKKAQVPFMIRIPFKSR